MARPHDIWEFGWTGGYDNRHAYIQSLPENEQEWATMLFHYIDYAFQAEVFHKTSQLSSTSDTYSDRVEQIRNDVKDRLEPPTDDRWKVRFKRDEAHKFYEKRKDTDD
jgi:hypothetical protein